MPWTRCGRCWPATAGPARALNTHQGRIVVRWAMASRNWAPVAALIVVTDAGACTHPCLDRRRGGSGQPPASPPKQSRRRADRGRATCCCRTRLTTPLGPAIAIPWGTVTSPALGHRNARAALLFKGHRCCPPAHPTMPSSAYQVAARPCTRNRPTSTPMPSTITTWCGKALAPYRIVVARPLGLPRLGTSNDETQLFATPADGVLVWTMTRRIGSATTGWRRFRGWF